MRKGIIRIVLGVVFLILQVISLIVNFTIASEYSYLYSGNTGDFKVSYYLGFYGLAIIGILLLKFGIRAYNSGEKVKLILHKERNAVYVIVKYFVVILLVLSLAYHFWFVFKYSGSFGIANLVSNNMLLSTTAIIFMLVYLLFYQCRKPSYLFSGFLIVLGIIYVYRMLENMDYNIKYFSEYYLIVFLFNAITVALYIVQAVMMYRETFSVRTVKVFGLASFILVVFDIIVVPIVVYGGLYFHWSVFAYTILLPLIAFIYTCVIPIQDINRNNSVKPSFSSLKCIKILIWVVVFCIWFIMGFYIEYYGCSLCDMGFENTDYATRHIFEPFFIGVFVILYWYGFWRLVEYICVKIDVYGVNKIASRYGITAFEYVKSKIPSHVLSYCESVCYDEETLKNYLRTSIKEREIEKTDSTVILEEFKKLKEKPNKLTRCTKCGYSGYYSANCPKCDYSGKIYVYNKIPEKEFNKELNTNTTAVNSILVPRFCRKCGTKLGTGNRFCAKCGTEIIVEVQ